MTILDDHHGVMVVLKNLPVSPRSCAGVSPLSPLSLLLLNITCSPPRRYRARFISRSQKQSAPRSTYHSTRIPGSLCVPCRSRKLVIIGFIPSILVCVVESWDPSSIDCWLHDYIVLPQSEETIPDYPGLSAAGGGPPYICLTRAIVPSPGLFLICFNLCGSSVRRKELLLMTYKSTLLDWWKRYLQNYKATIR